MRTVLKHLAIVCSVASVPVVSTASLPGDAEKGADQIAPDRAVTAKRVCEVMGEYGHYAANERKMGRHRSEAQAMMQRIISEQAHDQGMADRAVESLMGLIHGAYEHVYNLPSDLAPIDAAKEVYVRCRQTQLDASRSVADVITQCRMEAQDAFPFAEREFHVRLTELCIERLRLQAVN